MRISGETHRDKIVRADAGFREDGKRFDFPDLEGHSLSPMDDTGIEPKKKAGARRKLRLWPAILITALGLGSVVWVRLQESWPFQARNIATAQIVAVFLILLVLWWTFFSRAPGRLRVLTTFGLVGAAIVGGSLFRLRGLSGDLAPIFEFRWSRSALTEQISILPVPSSAVRVGEVSTNDFPQFLGPNRDGVLPGQNLETNWTAQPPKILWQQPVGAGWSGFAVVGTVCLTQEQRGESECVTAYDLASGKPLWTHSDQARYNTIVAGDGPRATPTVVSNRVYTLGATGLLNCLDLATGKQIWSRDLLADGGKVPDWGVASSPLYLDDMVVVHGSGKANSLFAFRADDGKPVWEAGAKKASYASPILATLAGKRQIVAFNQRSVSGHDPKTGAVLWESSWGNGNVTCAAPVVISSNQVLFSSGYGVGSELLEISRVTDSEFAATRLWKSIRMKSKFAHLYARDGFLYGLDDGIFACVDLKDGSLRWKEGRYGHGQGLRVGELYLLMAESGELTLLRPTPEAPNELERFPVFEAKTWNPIALAGDLLLVRNDQEAACLRLPLAK